RPETRHDRGFKKALINRAVSQLRGVDTGERFASSTLLYPPGEGMKTSISRIASPQPNVMPATADQRPRGTARSSQRPLDERVVQRLFASALGRPAPRPTPPPFGYEDLVTAAHSSPAGVPSEGQIRLERPSAPLQRKGCPACGGSSAEPCPKCAG